MYTPKHIHRGLMYTHLLALREYLLANMLFEIFRLHTHAHFVLPPASPEFCLPTWCLYQQVEQLAGPSTLEVLGHRFDVWVIKSACGAQHAANTLPVSVSVCSLTERAQLLKNVFKKSTVSLYRSDSMQQNLLHGYAFSQDENGVVSQSEVIRAYDTTKQRTNEW
ncbi:putative phospholipid-transporting ATPase IA [Collichthys lucidus]|uniref:Putative phospholipid-transporting ATPase IA n=1 Tax=Collichthys lucidus TaxID=240159 RepID=A0A4U5UC98_COLLU|nr:putative phospholipid-transporting ATPase IA [Collichthys lucidus]